jgi:hypothetical protein
MDDYGIDLLQEALRSTKSGPKPTNKSGSRPFKKKDVPSLAKYIQSDACRKIYFMVICLILKLFRGLVVSQNYVTTVRCRCAPCQCPVRGRTLFSNGLMFARSQYLCGDTRLSFSGDRHVCHHKWVIASDLLHAYRAIRKKRSTISRSVTELDRVYRSRRISLVSIYHTQRLYLISDSFEETPVRVRFFQIDIRFLAQSSSQSIPLQRSSTRGNTGQPPRTPSSNSCQTRGYLACVSRRISIPLSGERGSLRVR